MTILPAKIVHIETLGISVQKGKNTYSTCILKVKSLTMMTVRQSFGEVHSVGGTVVTNNITPCLHASNEGVIHWFGPNLVE